jgi:hypothetical protein
VSTGELVRERAGSGTRLAALVAGGAALAVAAAEIAWRVPSTTSPVKLAAVVFLLIVAGVFIASPRVEITLGIFFIYLGCLDGYLKLKTASSVVTLGRDVLLFSIAIGMLARAWLSDRPLRLPPLAAWPLLYVALVLAEIFNPQDLSVGHSLAALRPHLEFIPLFFIGNAVMRTKNRLRWGLIIFLVIASANAIGGILQFGDSPQQLASWGPGYASAVYGTSTISERVFTDSAGNILVRPFALGGDFGFGGLVGAYALPALVALMMLSTTRRQRLGAIALAPGVFLAIVTSDSRTAIIISVVSILAMFLLAATSHNIGRALAGLLATGVVGVIAIVLFTGSNASSEFSRYSSISPTQAGSTSYNYRSNNIAQVPQYMGQFPFGDGLGSVGPASGAAGGQGNSKGLDAEGELLFLVIEVGIPGVVVITGFMLRLMQLSLTRLRRLQDPELRVLLAAFGAPIFTLLAAGFDNPTTAATPGSPVLWFFGGILGYWLFTPGVDRPQAPPVAAERNGRPASGARARIPVAGGLT